MYRLDDAGSTFLSLPPNLQTTENECFGYALDRQIARMYKLAKQITVWSDLDHVDPKYYDYLAMTIRAPYYKSEYDNNQKLGLIKSALLTRRNAGTIKAIEELMSHTLTGASFIPWYEYGGKPYSFKVVADADEVNDDNMGEFVRMISAIKSARSIMEGIGMKSDIDNSMLYDMRLNRVCFFMRTPFYSTWERDGAVCHGTKRKYRLGVGLDLHLEIKCSKEEISDMAVESRRNVQYYNGKKLYNGTTKYNAMIRRDEIE